MKLVSIATLSSLIAFSAFGASPRSLDQIKLLESPNKIKSSSVSKDDVVSLDRLENMFKMDAQTPGLVSMIKRHTLKHKQKAVPLLIKVMKDDKFPEQNRWQATMLLGQVMGKKSAPFIAKFANHPHWMMRVASLKALLALKQSEYHQVYANALKDNSLIVRVQALDNISKFQIQALGPNVWQMMYDQSNYSGEAGNRKRTSIVSSIIRTLGDIKYEKASVPLAKLMQKPKYQDLLKDLDYSLEKLTGQKSPDSSAEATRKFWSSKIKLASTQSAKKI